MLKICISILSRNSRLCANNAAVNTSQSVRWMRYRKPIFLGPAPYKKFKVTGKKRLPPDQRDEKARLEENYDIFLASTRGYLQEMASLGEESEHAELIKIEEAAEEHKKMMEYNRLENERVLNLRMKRRATELKEELLRIDDFKKDKIIKEQEVIEAGLDKINSTQELAKEIIREEDLVKAIEYAMANPTDYNFAIDIDGYMYSGKSTKISSREYLKKRHAKTLTTSTLRPDMI